MSARKADLEEEIELLRSALAEERKRCQALWAENQRLVASVLRASEQYDKLVAYVLTLRDWAANSSAKSSTGGKKR